MPLSNKLAILKEMLDSAESSLRSARQIIAELVGEARILKVIIRNKRLKLECLADRTKAKLWKEFLTDKI